MTELDLLKKLGNIENDHIKANFDVIYADSQEKKENAEFIKQRIEENIQKLKTELIEISNKNFSNKAKTAINRQINHYIEQINQAKPGARLTRSQGMIGENMLLGFIAKDIYYLITDEIHSIHIPAYLQYTYAEKDSISIDELTQFLRSELIILNNIQNVNYIELREFFEEFKNRIFSRFTTT
jgi:anaerobic ribonucleoside-triphosphate reductase